MQTFNLGDLWLAHEGEFVAFGTTEDQAKNAAQNPNSFLSEGLILRFEQEEWNLIAAYAQSLDRIVPITDWANDGDEKRPGEAASLERTVTPADLADNGLYAVLSPAGRKYGTWAVIKQSARDSSSWDIVMPDVGSAQTAKRLVSIMNSQGTQVGRIG